MQVNKIDLAVNAHKEMVEMRGISESMYKETKEIMEIVRGKESSGQF